MAALFLYSSLQSWNITGVASEPLWVYVLGLLCKKLRSMKKLLRWQSWNGMRVIRI